MHKYTSKITVRKDTRADGRALLYLQCFINGKIIRIPLNQYIYPEQLISNKQGAFIKSAAGFNKKSVNDLNLELANALAKASDIFTEHRLGDKALTPEMFQRKYTNASLKNDFVAFWEAEKEKMKDTHAPATIDMYGFALDKLTSFRAHITFADLDSQFLDDFNRFLFRQKLSQNTVSKYHIRVKKMINLAIRYNIMTENPYKYFRLKFNRTGRTYLDLTEQNKLLDLYQKKELLPYLQNLLARFLFSCFSSLRWSDNIVVTDENIWDTTLVISASRKTKNVLRIPLTAPGEKFLRDIINKDIPVIQLHHANVGLKTISEAAGIKKTITTHVGRHTYATTFLKLGGKVQVLQKIMDHSKIETTMVYVHIIEEDKQESAEMFNVFMKRISSDLPLL